MSRIGLLPLLVGGRRLRLGTPGHRQVPRVVLLLLLIALVCHGDAAESVVVKKELDGACGSCIAVFIMCLMEKSILGSARIWFICILAARTKWVKHMNNWTIANSS